MWHEFLVAFCLMLVLEGIVPFLYPARWRSLVAVLAQIDDTKLRQMGFASMVVGTFLLYLIN
ncbi:MAG: DUF2065 domain-containing protein [Pseudomonadota bacterium]